MNEKQIIDTIHSLAHSQGFYGRLYSTLTELKDESEGEYNSIMKRLVNQKFSDPVDLILFLEG